VFQFKRVPKLRIPYLALTDFWKHVRELQVPLAFRLRKRTGGWSHGGHIQPRRYRTPGGDNRCEFNI